MAKTAEELKALRTECEQMGQKLQALDADELKQVCGGAVEHNVMIGAFMKMAIMEDGILGINRAADDGEGMPDNPKLR